MRASLAGTIAFVLTTGVFAQAPIPASPNPQVADIAVVALLEQARKSGAAGRLDEAHAKVDQALALAEKSGDRVGVAMCYRLKGYVFNQAGRGKEAIEILERAVAAFDALGNRRGIAESVNTLAFAHQLIGNLDRSREYGYRAMRIYQELGDDLARAWVLLGLERVEPPERSRALVAEAIAIGRKVNDKDLLANALRALASDQFGAGEYAASRKTHEEAILLLEEGTEINSLAATYLSLGRVFRAHGDYEGALVRYGKAIELLAPTKDRYTIVEAYNASGIALGALGRHKDAIAMYERGLALARESGNQRTIDFMEANLAGGLLIAGETARAIPLLEAALAKKPDANLAAFRQSQLGLALARVGRAAEGLPHLDESIRFAREFKQVEQIAVRLENRAFALTALGRYEDALIDSRAMIGVTEELRANLVPVDFLKRGFADRIQKGYLSIVDLLSRLGRDRDALETAEQSRARAFLDLLAGRESAASAPASGPGAATPPAAGPEDLASAAMGKPLDAAGMAAVARRLRSTLVSFWVGEEATLVWVIRPDAEPAHVRIPLGRAQLLTMVAATTSPLRDASSSAGTRGADSTGSESDDLVALPMRGLGLLALTRDDKASWRALYKTLIEPIRKHLPTGTRLTIVPHGPLFQLSFGALLSAAGRYLVEDFELHYAPAVSALEFTGRRQESVAANSSGPWAIVGNPTSLPMVRDKPLPPLPGAAREIAAIVALAPRGQVLRLDGARADEASLAAALDKSRPSLVHFATHGFVFDDPKVPPFLALNRRGPSAAEDGRLTMDEVYGLRLSTNLVVLSACRSGSGKVSSDGIVGLTRGFFYAGSPSVLATFWDVTDQVTATLMSNFYRSYVKAGAKGGSLRSAQLELLRDLRAGKIVVTAGGRRVPLPEHPLLWAAFFLSGEP